MPQVKDGVKSTVKFTIDAATTSVELNNAATFPDPALGQYWVWMWDATTTPNAADDSNAERVRVTGKAGNILTIVRGEAGQTAIGHAAGQACRMLVDEANTKCTNHYDVTVFGAVGDTVTNNTDAYNEALLASAKTGHPVYTPPGIFSIGNVTWPVGVSTTKQLTFFGAGRQSSIIRFFSNVKLTLKELNLSLIVRDLEFRAAGGVVSRKVEIGTAAMECMFERVKFNGQGTPIDSMLFMDDVFHADFISCVWTTIGGWCVDSVGVLNGGNFRFYGCTFNFVAGGFFTRNGATNNNILFLGTKFLGSHQGDWDEITDLNNVAGPWTSGATSIFIGVDRDGLAPSTFGFVATNDNKQEYSTMATYNSTTGVATLNTPLENDWTGEAGASIFVGSCAVFMGLTTSNLSMENCHFEGTPVIIGNCHANSFNNCLSSFSEAGSKAAGANLAVSPATEPIDTFGFYITGRSSSHVFSTPRWTTDRADSKFCYITDAAGSLDLPNNVTFIEPLHLLSGAPNPIAYPAKVESQNSKILVLSQDEIRIGQFQADSSRWGMRHVTGTAQLEMRQMRLHTMLLNQTFVNDADYTITTGLAADDILIVITNLTTPRTITLPAAAQGGRKVYICKATADAFAVTIDRNGNNIMGAAANSTIASGAAHDMYTYTLVQGDTGWHESIES